MSEGTAGASEGLAGVSEGTVVASDEMAAAALAFSFVLRNKIITNHNIVDDKYTAEVLHVHCTV